MATVPDLSGASTDIGRLRTALASRYLQAYKHLAARDGACDASAATAHVSGATEYETGRSLPLTEHSGAAAPKRGARKGKGVGRYGKLGVGFLEARDEQGVWWPVTVVSENQDKSFTVRVRASKKCDRKEMVVPESALRAGKRRTAVMLPKGASVWTDRNAGKGEVSVVVPDAEALRDGPPAPLYDQPETAVATGKAYYTLERCYEELANTRNERALLAREVSALRGKLRAVERQSVVQLDDLLGKAVPQTKLTVSTTDAAFPKKQNIKHWEDVHNVMIRVAPPPAANQLVIRGAKRDCFNVFSALDGAGVVSEEHDDEFAVNSAVRFAAGDRPGVSANAVGYVASLSAAGDAADVRFAEALVEAVPLKDLVLVQSPILWCSAAKISVPLVCHGHFNILKNELMKERTKAEQLAGRLEMAKHKGGGSAMQRDVDVKKLADFVDMTQAEKDSVGVLRGRVGELELALQRSEEERAQLRSQIEAVGEMTRDEVAKLKQRVREEKTGKLLAENHMAMEGQWRCEAGEGRAGRTFEILANNAGDLVFREHVTQDGAPGYDIHGVLHPIGDPSKAPAAVASVAEYTAALNDGGTLWLGRSERCKLVRAYRGSVEEKVEVVSTAVKVVAAADRVAFPPLIDGVCPRCGHSGNEVDEARKLVKRTELNAEAEHVRNVEKLAEASAELTAVLGTKEAELQQALRAIDELKKGRPSEGADVEALEAELRKCKNDLKNQAFEAYKPEETAAVQALKADVAKLRFEKDAAAAAAAKLQAAVDAKAGAAAQAPAAAPSTHPDAKSLALLARAFA
eukprot:TRINITY_DN5687_c0_g1_i1.p1 TRINITY_DN5687_c0_g1~~TRINITY_DN5687_c0_g1_i1.p1  ORF type:complete len:802 (+),score=327.63 TRINITY_DN5687_c0_g1_i1:87-2492(+)